MDCLGERKFTMIANIILILCLRLCTSLTIYRDIKDGVPEGKCEDIAGIDKSNCVCKGSRKTIMTKVNDFGGTMCLSPIDCGCDVSSSNMDDAILITENSTSSISLKHFGSVCRKITNIKVWNTELTRGNKEGYWIDITKSSSGHFKLINQTALFVSDFVKSDVWRGQVIRLFYDCTSRTQCSIIKVKGRIKYPFDIRDLMNTPTTKKTPLTRETEETSTTKIITKTKVRPVTDVTSMTTVTQKSKVRPTTEASPETKMTTMTKVTSQSEITPATGTSSKRTKSPLTTLMSLTSVASISYHIPSRGKSIGFDEQQGLSVNTVLFLVILILLLTIASFITLYTVRRRAIAKKNSGHVRMIDLEQQHEDGNLAYHQINNHGETDKEFSPNGDIYSEIPAAKSDINEHCEILENHYSSPKAVTCSENVYSSVGEKTDNDYAQIPTVDGNNYDIESVRKSQVNTLYDATGDIKENESEYYSLHM